MKRSGTAGIVFEGSGRLDLMGRSLKPDQFRNPNPGGLLF